MKERSNVGLIITLVVIALLMGVGGFFLGMRMASDGYLAEEELNIRLNRSELEGLGKIEGTIYVTGHKTPDTDTVGCAIGYAALLRALGYDAKAVVLGEINNETKFVLEKGGIETPELLLDAAGLNVVLVDHSEYAQSADGLGEANVISIIDHHGDGSVTTGNQLIYDARPLGAAATIVWMRYRNYGVEPDQKTAFALLGAILSDTNGLNEGRYTAADEEAVKALQKIAGVKDVKEFYQEMYKALISYEGFTDEEIYLSDYKEYETGAKGFAIGSVNAYDETAAKDLSARIKTVLQKGVPDAQADFLFAQIGIYHDDLNINYLVAAGEAGEEVLRTAFPDAVFDGTAFRLEPGVSRRKVLVPAITDVLEAYPKD